MSTHLYGDRTRHRVRGPILPPRFAGGKGPLKGVRP